MTYIVSSGTLNPTIPYHTILPVRFYDQNEQLISILYILTKF